MANEKNLKPFGNGSRTENEEREIQSKGGKASGTSRRKKKTLKAAAEMVLGLPMPPKMKESIKSWGVDDENAILQTGIIIAHVRKALDGDKDSTAWLTNILGEEPQYKLKEMELKLKREELKLKQAETRAAKNTNAPTAPTEDGDILDDVPGTQVNIYLPKKEESEDGDGGT